MLDTFSGVGGFSLAARWTQRIETVQFIEIDPFCREVLKKHWPTIDCHDDIRTFDCEPFRGRIDILTGGFPCQDLSVAGKGAGLAGERSGLWFDLLRVIRGVGPRWCLIENARGITSKSGIDGESALDTCLRGLEAAGYTVWTHIVGAWAAGAPHGRDRVWIVAHRASERQPGLGRPLPYSSEERKLEPEGFGEADDCSISDCPGSGCERGRASEASCAGRDQTEPRGLGVAVGQADSNSAGWREQRSTEPVRAELVATEHGSPCSSLEHTCVGGSTGKPRRRAGQESADGCDERTVEPGLGSDADGLPARLDGHRWPFPMLEDEEGKRFAGPQWEWEPPRLAQNVKHRGHRLRAQGNAIVPQVAHWFLEAILDLDRDHENHV